MRQHAFAKSPRKSSPLIRREQTTIAGIGNDIIDLERVKRVHRFSTQSVLRILTPAERIKYRKSRRRTELWGRFF